MGYFFQFSFWFAWLKVHIWYIPGFSMCVHASLAKNGYHRGLLESLPFDFQGASCVCCRKVSWLLEWEICGLGKVHPPPLIVLLFSLWSFCPWGNDSPITLLGLGVSGYLLPASVFAGHAVAPTEEPVLVSDTDSCLGGTCVSRTIWFLEKSIPTQAGPPGNLASKGRSSILCEASF